MTDPCPGAAGRPLCPEAAHLVVFQGISWDLDSQVVETCDEKHLGHPISCGRLAHTTYQASANAPGCFAFPSLLHAESKCSGTCPRAWPRAEGTQAQRQCRGGPGGLRMHGFPGAFQEGFSKCPENWWKRPCFRRLCMNFKAPNKKKGIRAPTGKKYCIIYKEQKSVWYEQHQRLEDRGAMQWAKLPFRDESKAKQNKIYTCKESGNLPQTHLLKRSPLRVYSRKTKAYPRKRKTEISTLGKKQKF